MAKEIGQLRLGPLNDLPKLAQLLQNKINELVVGQQATSTKLSLPAVPEDSATVEYILGVVDGLPAWVRR